jgi:hypothetical protein
MNSFLLIRRKEYCSGAVKKIKKTFDNMFWQML